MKLQEYINSAILFFILLTLLFIANTIKFIVENEDKTLKEIIDKVDNIEKNQDILEDNIILNFSKIREELIDEINNIEIDITYTEE